MPRAGRSAERSISSRSLLKVSAGKTLRSARGLSLDAHQLHVEYERRAGRNHATRAAVAVGEVRRNSEAPLAADLHAGHALIPTRDHLPGAERHGERLV